MACCKSGMYRRTPGEVMAFDYDFIMDGGWEHRILDSTR